MTFHPKLVMAMKEEGKNRILLTEMFSKLPTDAFCVYRYFYGFSDSNLLNYLFDFREITLFILKINDFKQFVALFFLTDLNNYKL